MSDNPVLLDVSGARHPLRVSGLLTGRTHRGVPMAGSPCGAEGSPGPSIFGAAGASRSAIVKLITTHGHACPRAERLRHPKLLPVRV